MQTLSIHQQLRLLRLLHLTAGVVKCGQICNRIESLRTLKVEVYNVLLFVIICEIFYTVKL